MYLLLFDGLFEGVGPNASASKAGFMSYGWLIERDGLVVGRGHGVFARSTEATSSVAEYLALIEGLEALGDLGVEDAPIRVFGDARSVIEQMQGNAAVHSVSVKPLHQRASRLARRFQNLEWSWTSRKNNRDADALTRLAMKQIHSDRSRYLAAVQAIDPRSTGRRLTKKFLSLSDLRVYQPAF